MPTIDTFKIATYPPVGQAIVLQVLDGAPPVPMVVTENHVDPKMRGNAYIKGILLKDGVYGEGYHAKSGSAGDEVQVFVAYGDEWKPFVKRNPSYEVTVSPKSPAWNERPYTVRVWAPTAKEATARVRKQVKDGWVFPGGATYRAREAQDEE